MVLCTIRLREIAKKMAERTAGRRRSRSRSPVRRNSETMGIQDRLKKISGADVRDNHSSENGIKETKIDREKVYW